MSLGYYELFDKAEGINSEFNKYKSIDAKHVSSLANTLFQEKNSSVLFYKAKNNG